MIWLIGISSIYLLGILVFFTIRLLVARRDILIDIQEWGRTGQYKNNPNPVSKDSLKSAIKYKFWRRYVFPYYMEWEMLLWPLYIFLLIVHCIWDKFVAMVFLPFNKKIDNIHVVKDVIE